MRLIYLQFERAAGRLGQLFQNSCFKTKWEIKELRRRFLSSQILQVSISFKTIPPGHDLKGAKTLPPPDNHCVQKPWTKQGVKSPTPGT